MNMQIWGKTEVPKYKKHGISKSLTLGNPSLITLYKDRHKDKFYLICAP